MANPEVFPLEESLGLGPGPRALGRAASLGSGRRAQRWPFPCPIAFGRGGHLWIAAMYSGLAVAANPLCVSVLRKVTP